MRQILSFIIFLLIMINTCGAQTLESSFAKNADGSGIYTVGSDDYRGQWGIMEKAWLELVAANPQLEDSNVINPGDRLNVPASLVPMFAPTTEPDIIITLDTTLSTPNQSEVDLPLWVWIILILGSIFIIAGSTYVITYGTLFTKICERDAKREAKLNKATAARKLADPYSGPNQVKGGLLTAESAIQHFTDSYRNQRNAMTVAESNTLPDNVRIIRRRAVDICGPMEISYAGSKSPETKEIKEWIPAWQVFLDDGTWSISLMYCGNDVWYKGKRMTPLFEDQIRDRQDIPEIKVDRQIWPIIDEKSKEAEAEAEVNYDLDKTSSIPIYRKLIVESPSRWLLHKHDGGNPDEINIAPLGDMLKLSFVDDQIIAETKDGHKHVIGEIIENLSNEEKKALNQEFKDLDDLRAESTDNDEQSKLTKNNS